MRAPIAFACLLAITPGSAPAAWAQATEKQIAFGSSSILYRGTVRSDRAKEDTRLIEFDITPAEKWRGGKILCQVQWVQTVSATPPSEYDARKNALQLQMALDAQKNGQPGPIVRGKVEENFDYFPYYGRSEYSYVTAESGRYQHSLQRYMMAKQNGNLGGRSIYDQYVLGCNGSSASAQDDLVESVRRNLVLIESALPPDARRR